MKRCLVGSEMCIRDRHTTEQKKLPYVKESKDEDWPDEMDFKVERWQRASEKELSLIHI